MRKYIVFYITIALLLITQVMLVRQKNELNRSIKVKDHSIEQLAVSNNSLQTYFVSSIDNSGYVLDGVLFCQIPLAASYF